MKRVCLFNRNFICLVILFSVIAVSITQATSDTEEQSGFPFTIKNSRFWLDGKPIFLNIIDYQPLEPGQGIWSKISENRLRGDLRRLKEYAGGMDPVVLRIYPQPSVEDLNRIPKFFYDGIRDLDFWIIRDIYFGNLNETEGEQQIKRVIQEVSHAGALHRIFAWEIGDEFEVGKYGSANEIKLFVENMCLVIKNEISILNMPGISDWVTWASWVSNDPLYTDGSPVEPNGLTYISYNAYSYEPERLRDQQEGPTTGTPYQGYLAALKARYPDKPLLITETGFSDSPLIEPDSNHERFHAWYPAYRKGGLTGAQVAEGLADRYWDARLLADAEEPNLVIAGMAVFEWNDEWHKAGEPGDDDHLPEEHFGLARFEKRSHRNDYQLRNKLQRETIRELYTLDFTGEPNILVAIEPNDHVLSVGGSTTINAILSEDAEGPIKFRWENNRGYIIGDSNSVEFYAGSNYLGPAKVTAVAIDKNGNASKASTLIEIENSEPNYIEIFTYGQGYSLSDPNVKASGRISNVNLDKYKLVVYVKTNKYYVQPFAFNSIHKRAMKSIWIDSEGYWWTKVTNDITIDNELYCWLVDKNWDPPDEIEIYELDNILSGANYIAEASTANMDPNDYWDEDNDLLPDWWEIKYFDDIESNDRYEDLDEDMAYNLEEFLRGTSPLDPNDEDKDGLWDNWEYHFFGRLSYDANDNPDRDCFNNLEEMNLGLHPGRKAADSDGDGLPDVWEIRWFNHLAQNAKGNLDLDGCSNMDEYELGLNPLSMDLKGDLNCDCIVDLLDLMLYAAEWPSPVLITNISPDAPDRVVNLLDYAMFANAWLSNSESDNWNSKCDFGPNGGDGKVDFYDWYVFAGQWLGYYQSDIYPNEGDGKVDLHDFAVFADNWLEELW